MTERGSKRRSKGEKRERRGRGGRQVERRREGEERKRGEERGGGQKRGEEEGERKRGRDSWQIDEKWDLILFSNSEWSADQITKATEISNRLGLIPPLMEQPHVSKNTGNINN